MGLIIASIEFEDAQGRVLHNYVSNVLDAHTIRMTLRAKFNLVVQGSMSLTVVDNIVFLNGGGDWQDYGAMPGIQVSGNIGGNILAATDILNVENDYIVLDSVSLTPGEFSSGELIFDIDPEAMQLELNLTPSTGPGNNQSLIDGNPNGYITTELAGLSIGSGPSAIFNELLPRSGGPVVFPLADRLADDFDGKVYLITIPDFKNFLWTVPEAFTGSESPKLWIRASVFAVAYDPSVSISTIHTSPTGNLGFFDEVYNGGAPEYGPVSHTYTVGGDTAQNVDPTQETDFTIIVPGIFTSGSKFGIAFYHDIEISDAEFFDAHIENNSMLCVAEALVVGSGNPDITGSSNSIGGRVDIIDINISQSGTSATISGTIVPNSQFGTSILGKASELRKYRVAVKVEDSTLTGNYIRPVWLTVSYGLLEKFVPPLGAYPAFGYTTRNHKDNGINYVPVSGDLTAQSLITEDDIAIELSFTLPRPSQQLVIDRTFTGITLSLVAHKDEEQFFKFEGETITVDFTSIPEVDDAVPVFVSSPRNFKLPPTTEKNAITIERNTGIDTGTAFGLAISYGALLDWRYWLPEINASSEFFVAGPPPNGLTRDWFHYQNGDWKVALLCEIHTSDGDYQNFVDLTHETYDQGDVTSEILFFRMDDTPINGPLDGEIVKVVGRHTITGGFTWETGTVWGMLTVEPEESQPRWMLSSYLDQGGVSQNPLQPLSGQTKAQRIYSGGNTIVEFWGLFDSSKLPAGARPSFTTRVEGDTRKGLDVETVWNRYKETFSVSKIMTPEAAEKLLKECCEPRRVIADPDSLTPWKNDITSKWIPGDEVSFELRKNGIVTNYTATSVQLPNDSLWFSCTISWHDVIQSDGIGCYELWATTVSAGFEQTFKVETYDLWPATRIDGSGNVVPHEKTIGDCCVTVIYNFRDIKNGIDFTDSLIVDSLRFKGVFGKYQPNMKIDNEIDSNYRKQKIVRQNDDSFMLDTSPLSGKYMRMLLYMLLHENECNITDYNWQNVEYYRNEAVIVAETPQVGHEDRISRHVPVSCKFESKLTNSISSYNNRNASKLPTTITIGGNTIIDDGQIVNSDESYTQSFVPPITVLPDTTVETYEMVDGTPVLVDTFTFPTLEPDTEITIDL